MQDYSLEKVFLVAFDTSSKLIDVLFLRNMRGILQPSGGEVYLVNLARALPAVGVRPHFLFALNKGSDHEIVLDLFRDCLLYTSDAADE